MFSSAFRMTLIVYLLLLVIVFNIKPKWLFDGDGNVIDTYAIFVSILTIHIIYVVIVSFSSHR